MKRLKFLSCVLALVVGATAFTGCSGGKAAGGNVTTTITIWDTETHSKGFFDEAIANYNKTTGKEKGIIIDYKLMTDLAKQVELALANDTAPDIVLSLVPMQQQAEQGKIIALDDLPGGKEIIEQYQDYLTYNGFDDKTYRVPYNITTRGLVYNKEMFKAAGLVDEAGEAKPPETFDEVVEYAKKLTNKSKNEFGIVLPVKYASWINDDWIGLMMSSCGTNGYDPVTGQFDYSGLKPIVDMYLAIKHDASYMPGADALDNDTARARFAEGGIGMKFAASWDVAVLNDQFPAKIEWGVAPLPVADKNNKFQQQMSARPFGCVNAKSVKEKGAEKIIEVYKWFLSDEIINAKYEKGYSLPVKYDPETVGKVEVSKKGWKEFAEMATISVVPPTQKTYTYTGAKDLKKMLLEDVWTEKESIENVIKTVNDTTNEDAAEYEKTHPNYDASKMILDNWDIKRKD